MASGPVMIPKRDGDSTPLGQRSLSVLPVLKRLLASLGLGIPRSGFKVGYLSLSSILVTGCHLLMRGFPLHWTLRRFFLALGGSVACQGG